MLVESNPTLSHYVSEWYQYTGKNECFDCIEFVSGNKYRLVELGYGTSNRTRKLLGVFPYRKSCGTTYNVVVCTPRFVVPICYSSENAFRKFWTKCA